MTFHRKLKTKDILLRFFLMFAAVLIFTAIDWLFHQASPYLSVPKVYFTNKIIYGTLFAFICSLLVRKMKIHKQALIISVITVLLLQIRYALYGYTLLFHSIVIVEHFLILSAAIFFMLWLATKIQARRTKRKI